MAAWTRLSGCGYSLQGTSLVFKDTKCKLRPVCRQINKLAKRFNSHSFVIPHEARRKLSRFCQRWMERTEKKTVKSRQHLMGRKKIFCVCSQACLVTVAAVLAGRIRNVILCDDHLKCYVEDTESFVWICTHWWTKFNIDLGTKKHDNRIGKKILSFRRPPRTLSPLQPYIYAYI